MHVITGNYCLTLIHFMPKKGFWKRKCVIIDLFFSISRQDDILSSDYEFKAKGCVTSRGRRVPRLLAMVPPEVGASF